MASHFSVNTKFNQLIQLAIFSSKRAFNEQRARRLHPVDRFPVNAVADPDDRTGRTAAIAPGSEERIAPVR